MVCWSCNEAVSGPVCVSCGALQPPPPKPDPYALLGLERRWHLSPAEVEDAYRGLARKVHPDRFAGRPAVERRMALQWTAAINEARRVLKDDERRAWLLATGSAAPSEGQRVKLDPEFLQEMFEWREREEETPGALREQALAREAQLRCELERIFTAWESGAGDLGEVEDRLSRLKYVTGLLREQEHGEHRN